jgi:hypothetical protein
VSDAIRYIDPKEFQERGYLQEVNRLFLHPLGMALEIQRDEGAGAWAFRGVWDYRDDPEGITFAGEPPYSVEKAESVRAEREAKAETRRKLFGDEIQGGPEPRLAALLAAATELLKFGTHAGECDFGPECPTCERPTGACTGHGAALRSRTEALLGALAAFGVGAPPPSPTAPAPRCSCGCCDMADAGPCNWPVRGSNGRCVYCDHGLACHQDGLDRPRKRWRKENV